MRDVPAFDINSTVISQYANSPVILQLLANMQQYFDPSANFDAFYNLIWNVDTAVGVGLDIWGRIVGVNRVIQLGVSTYFGFTGVTGRTNASGDSFGGGPAPSGAAPFYSGGATTTNFSLGDDGYRVLILAKALANICDGSIPAINQILINLFLAPVPGRTGNCYCTDGNDMTMTYTFSVTPPLTPIELAIVENGNVLPRSIGVPATVVQI